MRSRDMVTPVKLAKIAESLEKPISMDYAANFGLACYEAGMEDVLREIATFDLDYGCPSIMQSKTTKEKMILSETKRQDLSSTLNVDQERLLKEYDDTLESAGAWDAADHYLTGFVRGYRYLKNYIVFHCQNELEENEQ